MELLVTQVGQPTAARQGKSTILERLGSPRIGITASVVFELQQVGQAASEPVHSAGVRRNAPSTPPMWPVQPPRTSPADRPQGVFGDRTGEADEGLGPSTPDRSALPDGVRGLQAVARRGDPLAVVAPPGRIRRPRSESDMATPVNPIRSWRRARPSRKGSLVRERPLEGRDEGVNPHSSLSRTKPSARGVAPDPARAARPATGDQPAWPQDVGRLADTCLTPCESPVGRGVK